MRQFSIALVAVLSLLSSVVSDAQTVFHNANGYSIGEEGRLVRFSTLVVDDDGRIVARGDAALREDFSRATAHDLAGKTVLPGLIDAHGHVLGLGLLQSQLDLAGTPTLDAAVAAIERHAAGNPGRRWILGRGWNQVLWPSKAFPNAAHIDAVVRERPVWLRRIDGHAGWANTAALKIAGIDDDTPDPPGGRIERDSNGHATGILIDRAMDYVEAHVPEPDARELRLALAAAMRALAAEGMTGVHDAGVDKATIDAYLSLADDDALPIRIYAMTAGASATLDAVNEPLYGYADDRFTVAAVKLYSDGALGSRGAAMIEPYEDDAENRGLQLLTFTELEQQISKANSMGFQAAVHAIGDLGNRMTLDAFANVQQGKPSPLRNRIEHAQIVVPDDIPRFAELGIIASMQAVHATSDMNMAEDRIGPERILGGYAWRRMLDAGVIIANGSDFPGRIVEPVSWTLRRRDATGPQWQSA